MPPKQTSPSRPAGGNPLPERAEAPASPHSGREVQATPAATETSAMTSAADQILAELRNIRTEIGSLRLEQQSTEGRLMDMSVRIGVLERTRDGRAPSPDTVAPTLKMEAAPARFSQQDARANLESTARFLDPALPPHLQQQRLEGPDVSISRLPDATFTADRSLSQRILDPALPDSDRAKLLEQDHQELAASGERGIDNDELWRTAYNVVRHDYPGISRHETFRKVKELVDEHSLKSAAAGILGTGNTRKKTDSGDRRIHLSGLNKIVELQEDNFDAWESDLWSFLQSYPKARAILFQDSCLGYDRTLDEELGGIIGLTVSSAYKTKVLRALRKSKETRGTVYLAQLAVEANRNTGSRKTLLRQKLLVTTQKAGEGIRAYAERHQAIARQLANIDDKLSEREMVNFFLKGVHASLSSVRDSLYAAQAAAGREMAYNEVVNFMLTMEEMRSLGNMTATVQPFGRFSARQASVQDDDQSMLHLEDLSEEDAHAFVAKFHQSRYSSRPGPPSGHPRPHEWFPGDCNLCRNPGHREAHCRLRARLDETGAGGGVKHDAQPSARHSNAEMSGDEVGARRVHFFHGDELEQREVTPAAKAAQVLTADLE
ncbi:hypothetical protein OC835_007424 [Tilletia horrida]|nr:hypothetical protein OC835_007424 [Tilletia horrida]